MLMKCCLVPGFCSRTLRKRNGTADDSTRATLVYKSNFRHSHKRPKSRVQSTHESQIKSASVESAEEKHPKVFPDTTPNQKKVRQLACDSASWLASSADIFNKAAVVREDTPEGGVLKLLGFSLSGLSDILKLLLLRKLVLNGKLNLWSKTDDFGMTWNLPSESGCRTELADVLPAGEGRGRGAFCRVEISAGDWIGDYEGERLSKEQFFERYPDGLGDYCIGDEEGGIWDGREVAKGDTFTLAHINHSRTRWNVVAGGSGTRVSFFASDDIQIGEELLLDYGRKYWSNRDYQEMP